MKERPFSVIKTKPQWYGNCSLHDVAQKFGENHLVEKEYSTIEYGEDRRDEDLWEDGEDKPDCFVVKASDPDKKICLLDWKGKSNNSVYCVNERAYYAYLKWQKHFEIPLIVAMAHVEGDEVNGKMVSDFVYFVFPNDRTVFGDRKKQKDGNYTVQFRGDHKKSFKEIDQYLNAEYQNTVRESTRKRTRHDAYNNEIYTIGNACYLKLNGSENPIELCRFDLVDMVLIFNRGEGHLVNGNYSFNEAALRLSKKCDKVRLICPYGVFDIPIKTVLKTEVWCSYADFTSIVKVGIETVIKYPMEVKKKKNGRIGE